MEGRDKDLGAGPGSIALGALAGMTVCQDQFAALVEAGAGEGDAGEAGELGLEVGGGPEAAAFERGDFEAFDLVEESVIELGGGGL